LLLSLFTQLFSSQSSQPLLLLFIPKPLESEIPAKYLDHKPKALDPPDLIEPELNTLYK
jgi:hypothetical protein